VGKGLSRREFLKAAGRLLALGGIGALAVRLLGGLGGGSSTGGAGLGGRGSRPPIGETCVNDGFCRACASFTGCGLPSALSARERAPGGNPGARPGS
jgi:hypothetical protein